MKYLAVGIAVLALSLQVLTQPPGGPPRFVIECQEESKVSRSDVYQAMTGNLNDNNQQLKCFFLCVWKKTGVMNDDGDFTANAKTKGPPFIDAATFGAAIDKCTSVKGEKGCSNAYAKEKCIRQAIPGFPPRPPGPPQ